MSDAKLEINPHLRVTGHDSTALEALADALADESIPIYGEMPSGDNHATDPFMIDTALQIAIPDDVDTVTAAAGISYAGMTPVQRGAFLLWSQDPSQPSDPAFQRLLIANIEVNLLDPTVSNSMLLRDLIRWTAASEGQLDEWYTRTLLLYLWLHHSGEGIADWTGSFDLPDRLLETAIGLQCMLNEELHVEQMAKLAAAWKIPGADNPPSLLALRMQTMVDSIGQPPLDAVREALTNAEMAPIPWRTAHRMLRFSVPQPNIRPYLEPLLQEALGMAADNELATQDETESNDAVLGRQEWRLVLEFGYSRSEFYTFVLELVQRMPGYIQLLDEDRRLVHRIAIRRREMRQFWRIWDYVQNWSTTHIYVRGEELEKWKVWPYSQYLR